MLRKDVYVNDGYNDQLIEEAQTWLKWRRSQSHKPGAAEGPGFYLGGHSSEAKGQISHAVSQEVTTQDLDNWYLS